MSKIPHMMAPFQQLVYSACDEYIHCTMISIFSGGAPKGVCMVIKMEIKSVIKFEKWAIQKLIKSLLQDIV